MNTLDPGMLAKKLGLVVMDFYLEPKLTLTFYLSGSDAAGLLTTMVPHVKTFPGDRSY